jgi:O-antigen/teichoic acid export membrane protein
MKLIKNKVAKASVSYTIGNYFIKGINFVTTPIFARMMTTEDYGIYNTFTAYESILYIFICLALHSTLKNAYYKYGDQLIDEYTSSVAIIPMFIASICCIFAVLFKSFLGSMLAIDSNLLLLLVIYSYCSGVLIYYRHRISVEYRSKEYLLISFYNVACNVLLSIVFILTIYSNQRYKGRILGGVVAYGTLALYILYKIYKKAKFKYNREYWNYGLKLALPLVPHGLAQIFLLQFDRIMINKMSGPMQAGIYSFSYTLYSFVQITATSLDTAFSPWVFQKLKDNELKTVRKVATGFMLVLAGISTIVMLFAPEIISLLGGPKYKDAVYSTIPIILAGFFAMTYTIPAVVEYYYEKTKYISIGTVIAAIVNVALNYIFIRKFGYIAAAYTTLVSYIIYYIIHTVVSRKLLGFYIINMRILFFVILILVTAYGIGVYFISNYVIRFSAAIIFVLIGCGMLMQVFEIKGIKKYLKK